ncbi:MAG: 50S ribosomal protein L23 [Chloroflexi bacterium]|nr:50S ribosomal protein L23 [Chloroflexota bacterium]
MTIYDVLRRPIVTEKSNHQNAKLHQYVFEVEQQASQAQIRQAVETLFDVDVLKINVMNAPARRTRRPRSRRVAVRRSSYKKAIVTIRADQTIDIFEGVK